MKPGEALLAPRARQAGGIAGEEALAIFLTDLT